MDGLERWGASAKRRSGVVPSRFEMFDCVGNAARRSRRRLGRRSSAPLREALLASPPEQSNDRANRAARRFERHGRARCPTALSHSGTFCRRPVSQNETPAQRGVPRVGRKWRNGGAVAAPGTVACRLLFLKRKRRSFPD
ncbi:hypothetical protein [Azospirillum doebereinerae]